MKPRLIIAGGGPTGLALASRAVNQWKVILIELDPAQAAVAAEIPELEVHTGDATSVLVLKRANVKGASYAVAVTGDDEVNLEFCRLMREQYGVHNLVALVKESGVAEALRSLHVVTVSRPASVASILESSLDHGRRTTSDIGLGKGEIYEVTVQSHSPVISRSLSELRPQAWLLGAIYRNGRLVVPHGSTRIEAGDKCLLIGDPEILPGIADYFQRGASEFPLQFGTRYCLFEAEDGRVPNLEECRWLLDSTEVKGVAVLHRGTSVPQSIAASMGSEVVARSIEGARAVEIARILDEVDCALMLGPPLRTGWRDRWGLGNRAFFDALGLASDPVLISRGSHPYKRILVAVSPSPGTLRAAELAVDVSRKFEADLTAVAVQPPDFVVGPEYKDKLNTALEAVKLKAHLYSRRVQTRLLEGNPVSQVLQLCREFDLLVLAHRSGRRFSLTRTDVSRHLVTWAPCSVMVLPFGQEDLRRG
jgi:Trk K+ transport system NAD-binding subunit/nucleotide-binding universal stress UspA family protein